LLEGVRGEVGRIDAIVADVEQCKDHRVAFEGMGECHGAFDRDLRGWRVIRS